MYKTIYLIIFILLYLPLKAQKGSSCPEDLVPKYGQNRQWGYTNILGQWVINPIYTKVSPYIENKAVVMKGLLYGVIDCEGNIVLPPQYEMLTNYRYGKIWAKQNNLWSLLSDKGKVLMPPQFSEINPIANTEYTWVQKEGMWGLLNEQRGNFLCKPQFKLAQIMSENASLVELNDHFGVVNHVNCQFLIPAEITKVKKVAPRIIVFQQKGKWGLFSEMGVIRLNPEFDTLFVKFNNVLEGRKGNMCGLYDLTGKELLAPVFESIGAYSEGYFPVKKNGKYGYASRFGKIFIQPAYDEAFPYKNQMAIVKQAGKYGIIDIRNKFIAPAKYEYINRNYDADYFVSREKGANGISKYYFMNKNFKKAYESGFDTIYVSDTTVLTRVVTAGKYNFFNTTLFKMPFNGNFEFASPFKNHLSKVKNAGKWGMVNESGQLVIPINYDSVNTVFWGGRQMVQTFLNGKTGIFDSDGKMVLPNDYEVVSFAAPNFLKAKKDGRYGLVKTTGTVIIPFTYAYLSNSQEHPDLPDWPSVAGKSVNQLVLVNEKGEVLTENKYADFKYLGEKMFAMNSGKNWIPVNARGEKVGEQSFDTIFAVSAGKMLVKKGKKWGYINTKGIMVIPFDYEEAYSFEEKSAVVKKNGKYGLLNSTGKFIILPEYDAYSKKNGEHLFTKEGNTYKLEKNGEMKILK